MKFNRKLKFIHHLPVNGLMKCDQNKRMITLTSDNIKRLSLLGKSSSSIELFNWDLLNENIRLEWAQWFGCKARLGLSLIPKARA